MVGDGLGHGLINEVILVSQIGSDIRRKDAGNILYFQVLATR